MHEQRILSALEAVWHKLLTLLSGSDARLSLGRLQLSMGAPQRKEGHPVLLQGGSLL